MKKIMLTGDRPTGKLHVGHYVGSLRRRVELQNTGDFDDIFIMIADAQALTDNADNPEKIRQNIIEVALDYLACGLDPAKSTLFIQSQIPELCELSFYYMNLVTVSRLQRNPTVKSEIQMRNFEASIPVGFFTYPISQAADITAFKATTVPVGEDQMPMLEQTKEIVHKFNSVYGETLVDPKILLPENEACLRLPGIDGKAKMSKSLGNCIYLSEEPDEIKKKVFSMFTDPNHIRIEDPGSLEGNTVFTYLDAFCRPEYFPEFLPEYKNLDELKEHYQRGGLGDMKVKRFLNNVLQAELEPIRNRRKEWQKDIPAVYEILKTGSEKAEAVAAQTLKEVKAAIADGTEISCSVKLTNTDRTFGTLLGAEITRQHPEGLPEDTITIHCEGAGGQSFGAFLPKGLTLSLCGDSNDYFGKGLSGGKLAVFAQEKAKFKPEENIIIGNVALYGATSGEAYIAGVAGERFCVRNSGATAVVEGVGEHGCEYMTGGHVVVLGPTGKNFAAGMSGGIAYVLDEESCLYKNLNKEMVLMEKVETKFDQEELRAMIEAHVRNTGSKKGQEVLDHFKEYLPKFKKIIPGDYKRMLQLSSQFEEQGMSRQEAQIEAFYASVGSRA